jgi:hypothetical protein
MQTRLHRKSWTSIVADYVDEWKTGNQWSRETTAEAIVNKYNEIYPNGLPGVEEFSTASDVFKRNSTNACRIFRWLDDRSKDKNLLEINFLPVILEAMPTDIKVRCINDLMVPLNVVSRSLVGTIALSESNPINQLKSLIKEASEACQSLAELTDGETYDELVTSLQELLELEKVNSIIQATIHQKIAALNVTQIVREKNGEI